MTLVELSAATSLHVNTLREHLDALRGRGSVNRHAATAHGRGRPAWLYEAPSGGLHADASGGLDQDTGGVAERGKNAYAALAITLATALHRTSRDPRAEGVDAGRTWGRALAGRIAPPAEPDDVGTRRRLVALLADLGFAPVADAQARSVQLTRCPLLAAARHQPDVVCGVHLGIVQGALETWGRPATNAALLPFSEPGACRLLLNSEPVDGADPAAAVPSAGEPMTSMP